MDSKVPEEINMKNFSDTKFMRQVHGASNWLSRWVRNSPVLYKVGPK